MDFIEKLPESNKAKVIYFAIILLLIMLIAWFSMPKAENLIGKGLGRGGDTALYGATSGATFRRLAQEFTQPGQGDYKEAHIPEIKEVYPNVVGKKEKLVGTRQLPQFMEIGSDLEAYQMEQSGIAETNDEYERLVPGSPASKLEEAKLYGLVHA